MREVEEAFAGRGYLRRLVCPAVSVVVFVRSAGRCGVVLCRTLCIVGLFYRVLYWYAVFVVL